MIDKRTPETIQSQEEQTRKFFLKAGTVYGLLLGLGFALFTWGYDALLLASSSADLAWARLLWRVVIFPYCNSAKVRTVLIVIISAFLGLIVGFVQSQAQEWVWDYATPEDRTYR